MPWRHTNGLLRQTLLLVCFIVHKSRHWKENKIWSMTRVMYWYYMNVFDFIYKTWDLITLYSIQLWGPTDSIWTCVNTRVIPLFMSSNKIIFSHFTTLICVSSHDVECDWIFKNSVHILLINLLYVSNLYQEKNLHIYLLEITYLISER